MNAPLQERNKGRTCETKDCTRPAHARLLCKLCWRDKYEKKTLPSERKYKGKYRKLPTINKAGYVVWYDPTSPYSNSHGHVYEHRKIMGEFIGRPLHGHETVHHKNGNRADNNIENLELWSNSQPYGQRVEDKVRWAREILALYDYEYSCWVDGKKFSA